MCAPQRCLNGDPGMATPWRHRGRHILVGKHRVWRSAGDVSRPLATQPHKQHRARTTILQLSGKGAVTTACDCSSPVLASRGWPPLTRWTVRTVIRHHRQTTGPKTLVVAPHHVDTRAGARALRLMVDPGENKDLTANDYVLGLGRPSTLCIFRKTRGPQKSGGHTCVLTEFPPSLFHGNHFLYLMFVTA